MFNNLPTISTNIVPTTNLQLVTKQYVDSLSSSAKLSYYYDNQYNNINFLPLGPQALNLQVMSAFYDITLNMIYLLPLSTRQIISINPTNNNIVNIQTNIPTSTSCEIFAYDYNLKNIFCFTNPGTDNPLFYVYNLLNSTTTSYTLRTVTTPSTAAWANAFLAFYSNQGIVYVIERDNSNNRCRIVTINTSTFVCTLMPDLPQAPNHRNFVYIPITNSYWCLPYLKDGFIIINANLDVTNTNAAIYAKIYLNSTLQTCKYISGCYYNNYIYLFSSDYARIDRVNIWSLIYISSSWRVTIESTTISPQLYAFSTFLIDTSIYILPNTYRLNYIEVYDAAYLNSNFSQSQNLNISSTFYKFSLNSLTNTNIKCNFNGGIVALDANDNIVIYGIPRDPLISYNDLQVYYFDPPTLFKGCYANYNILHPNNNFFRKVL
jgi:hypothetical protein